MFHPTTAAGSLNLVREWDRDSDLLRADAARRLLERVGSTARAEPAEFYFSRNFETSAALGPSERPWTKECEEGRKGSAVAPLGSASRALHSWTIPRMVLQWSG